MVDFKKLKEKINSEEYKIKKEEEEKQHQEFMNQWNQTCCFTGHRPHKLNNCYSFNHPTTILIKNKLTPIIIDLIIKEEITRFITGGALGVDQIAFWTVQAIKTTYPNIKNIVAKPFVNQNAVWNNPESLKWYYKMLKIADEVINVEDVDGYKTNESNYGDFSNAKMSKRNEWMVDNSRCIIAVWDGTKGGTGNCIYYAKKQMHLPESRSLYRLNPKCDFSLDIMYI